MVDTANTTHCLECDATWTGIEVECQDCLDAGVVEYLYVTTTPLGQADDDDYLIKGRYGQPDRWEYPVDE